MGSSSHSDEDEEFGLVSGERFDEKPFLETWTLPKALGCVGWMLVLLYSLYGFHIFLHAKSGVCDASKLIGGLVGAISVGGTLFGLNVCYLWFNAFDEGKRQRVKSTKVFMWALESILCYLVMAALILLCLFFLKKSDCEELEPEYNTMMEYYIYFFYILVSPPLLALLYHVFFRLEWGNAVQRKPARMKTRHHK